MLKNLNLQKLLFIIASIFLLVLCAIQNIANFVSINGFYAQKGQSFNDYNTLNGVSIERFAIIGAYIILNIIYVIWLLTKQQEYPKFVSILKYAAIFLVFSFITYPYSTDIYLYLHYGLMALNGVNPYINAANSFNSELTPFLAWSQTSTYGPISLLFFRLSALVIPLSPVLGVYVFKLFCLLFHIFNTYLIWRLLNANKYRSKVTAAYLINPLLLNEQVVSAHVDVFVTTTLIILICCLYYKRFAAAILAIFAGFLAKTLPIIWLPLVVNFLVRRHRWKDLAIAFAGVLAITIILSQTVFPTLNAWRSLFNPAVSEMTARSLHHLLSLCLYFFSNLTSETQQSVLSVYKSLTYLGFVICYFWFLLKPYLKRDYLQSDLVSDLGWVTLILFLFATPWLMSWYPSILLPFAALGLESPVLALTSLTFSLCAGLIVGTGGRQSLISIVTTLVTLLPPIAILVFRAKLLRKLSQMISQA